MKPDLREDEVRARAFGALDALGVVHGEALPLKELVQGFEVDGRRIPFFNIRRGIFKPSGLRAALSITTSPLKQGKPRPYEDELRPDGLIGYRYQGSNPSHFENVALREAMQLKVPLVYFYGLVPGWYLAQYPVFIVGDNPGELCFTVAADDPRLVLSSTASEVREEAVAARRLYVTRTAQQRLHQRSFRERVLQAYEACCAICLLRHANLLEAAHILPDGHPLGEPWVSNGLALCKLHHSAYDENILGIRPDRVVEIRKDVLREKDGPMLKHGLQELDGQPLRKVPRSRALHPNPEFLEIRYREFRDAG